MRTELTLEQIITFLLDAPMFGDLDSAELSRIVHIMQVKPLRADQMVFQEGDAGDAWYVVYDGELEVMKGRRVIATLGRGACFGEMAILDGSPRSASVRAVTDGTAFRFPRTAFGELLRDGNLAAYKLVHQIALVLAARQRATTSRLVDVLGGGDEGPLHALVDESAVRE
jgi:CRP-like cAMP-binding protein